jgi:hypothetical protein
MSDCVIGVTDVLVQFARRNTLDKIENGRYKEITIYTKNYNMLFSDYTLIKSTINIGPGEQNKTL